MPDVLPDRSGTIATRPLVATGDPALLDEVLRLAAAAGVEPEVASDAAAARRAWNRATAVLVGDDLAPALAARPSARRDAVVLIGGDRTDAEVWQRAVAVGAEHVVFLPEAQAWLVDLLSRTDEPPDRAAPVVCIVGARGGAGATCLAVALAVTAARSGRRTLLLDADPLGGGIDLALGAEDAVGLRWPDLAGAEGRVPATALAQALPACAAGTGNGRDLLVLSWDRGDLLHVPSAAMTALLDASTRTADLVVVDLPRVVDDSTALALERADRTLLVVPAELRACAAAGRMATALALHARDVRLVTRGPAPGGLVPEAVASSIGLPLAGSLRPEPGLAAALERGEPPAGRGRGPLARLCRQLLADLDGAEVAA